MVRQHSHPTALPLRMGFLDCTMLALLGLRPRHLVRRHIYIYISKAPRRGKGSTTLCTVSHVNVWFVCLASTSCIAAVRLLAMLSCFQKSPASPCPRWSCDPSSALHNMLSKCPRAASACICGLRQVAAASLMQSSLSLVGHPCGCSLDCSRRSAISRSWYRLLTVWCRCVSLHCRTPVQPPPWYTMM
jgi:hypothetical protein